MATMATNRKIAAEFNRILFVKNLSYSVTSDELYELFGKFGSIRQIRLGNTASTRGTAFVVYDEIQDAKMACEKLSGFNFQSRYLVVLYHQPDKMAVFAAGGAIPSATGRTEHNPAPGSTPRRAI
ncbi:uncharacterized protein V1510DRAFT_417543 [Dipodascopsis tothii]|uniref:uncharacterized protein n=1 Tax=Dipodascopsis tothii TaxID=44089 RepID=UPI0034CD0B52